MLGIDAALDGMAATHNRTVEHILQSLSRSQQNLALHQINIGDHLCDRMLHLNARIHLDEIKVPILIHQELDGSSIDVADIGEGLAQDLSDLLAQIGRNLS